MKLIIEIDEVQTDKGIEGMFDARIRIEKKDYSKESRLEDRMKHQAAMARLTLLTRLLKEE